LEEIDNSIKPQEEFLHINHLVVSLQKKLFSLHFFLVTDTQRFTVEMQAEIFVGIHIKNSLLSSYSSSIQPLGRFWQKLEPSQVTGMALARCILGMFFSPAFRRSHFRHQMPPLLHQRERS
jgi:hypothetical protein